MAALLNTVRDLDRLRQIVAVLGRHGLGEVLQRTGLGSLLGSGTKTEKPKVAVGERLRLAMQDLGPSAVKLGQPMSTRPDLIPPDVIETLEFLDGCKVCEAVAAGHSGELLSKNTLEILIKQTFEDGFFHAEPHTGNLIIMGAHDAPVLGMVDLGLVGRRGSSVRLRARWRGFRTYRELPFRPPLGGSMSIPVECDNAIVAHAAWKAKFRAFLSGTLTLDPVVVEKHNGCDFGKWLEGAGRSHLQAAEYERLHKLHAEFHRVAAGVVRLKLGGDVKGAQAQVEASGAFSKASAALTREVVVVRDTKR